MQYVIFVVRWQRSSERMQSVLGILCWHVRMLCAIRNGDTYCLCTCVFKMYIYIYALPYHAHPLAIFSRGDLGESPEENIQSIFTFHMLGLFIRVNGMKRANIGFILTPLTVNKMVCLYFYHPRGAPWFSWFFVFFFGGISGAVFPCFLSCFFWCLLVILLVVFFVLSRVLFPLYSGAFFRAIFRACPFSFLYIRFPLVVVFFFCVFFVPFVVLFFVHFFGLSRAFFSCFFFRALGGTQDKQPQYFAFWPVRFLVLFLVVTTSEDRIYTR